MASVLCDLESDHMREKEYNKKRETEAEENRRLKYKDKQVRENMDRLRCITSCEALVCSVFDHLHGSHQ